MDAVRVADLPHRFGDGESAKPVLHGVGLTVAASEVVLLTGPSGSGKTTLLTRIRRLRAVQEGSCVVLGTELAGADQATRVAVWRRIRFVLQHHNLLGFLTAQQNVAMALEIDARLCKTKRLARAERCWTRPGSARRRARTQRRCRTGSAGAWPSPAGACTSPG
jgi:putative ABC transport system ATP-binding protein